MYFLSYVVPLHVTGVLGGCNLQVEGLLRRIASFAQTFHLLFSYVKHLQQAQHMAGDKPGTGRPARASTPGSDVGKAGGGSKRQGKQKGNKKRKRQRKVTNPDDIDITTSHDLKAVMDMWRQTYSSVQHRAAEVQEDAEGAGKHNGGAPGASRTVRWVNSEDVKLQEDNPRVQ